MRDRLQWRLLSIGWLSYVINEVVKHQWGVLVCHEAEGGFQARLYGCLPLPVYAAVKCPRSTLWRIAAASLADCGRFTCSSHFRPSGNGLAAKRARSSGVPGCPVQETVPAAPAPRAGARHQSTLPTLDERTEASPRPRKASPTPLSLAPLRFMIRGFMEISPFRGALLCSKY